ncbi:hypothetical protein GQ42DRAFT_92290 [Ramicandelaber brevisporus]|nr:hypothetical protein GQ42DRAFT_92290 [Ramicandelaber brevisporus]
MGAGCWAMGDGRCECQMVQMERMERMVMCTTVPCCVVLCRTSWRCVVPFCIRLDWIGLDCIVLYCIVSGIGLDWTGLYFIVWYCAVSCCAVRCRMVLYCAILCYCVESSRVESYRAVSCRIVSYRAVSCCIVSLSTRRCVFRKGGVVVVKAVVVGATVRQSQQGAEPRSLCPRRAVRNAALPPENTTAGRREDRARRQDRKTRQEDRANNRQSSEEARELLFRALCRASDHLCCSLCLGCLRRPSTVELFERWTDQRPARHLNFEEKNKCIKRKEWWEKRRWKDGVLGRL